MAKKNPLSPDKKDGTVSSGSPSRPQAERSRSGRWLPLILLLVGGTILYLNSLSGGFVWDDRSLILQNPLVQNPHRIWEAFRWPLSIFGRTYGYYRPLVIFSFAFDQWLWQGRPWGFHLTNLFLHLGCAIALYFLLTRLWNRKHAFLASLLFSSFACHTENIAFISGRMDVLSTLFMFLCLLGYVQRWASHPLKLLVCSLFELAALLSKEIGFVFPVLFGLCVVSLYPRKEWRGHFIRGGLFIGCAFFVYGILRFYGTGRLGGVVVAVYPFAERLRSIPSLFLRYLQLLVVPFNLNARHITPPPSGITSIDFLAPLCFLAIIGIGVARLAWRNKWIALGSLWFFASLLPVLNLFPLEGATMLADHFLYLPSAGFALLVVALKERFDARRPPYGRWLSFGACAFLILVGLNNAIFTLVRNPVWHDEKRFFSRMVEQAPLSPLAHHNLGYVFYREGNWLYAETEYRTALALNPNYAEAHATLGDILTQTGRYKEAIQEYEAFLRDYPDAPNREQTEERIRKLKALLSGGDPQAAHQGTEEAGGGVQ
jgi:protein O-mannosyl-transferase